MNVSERRSFSPILEMYTLYLVDCDAIQIAYSVLPSKNTGASNSNEVAILPSAERLI